MSDRNQWNLSSLSFRPTHRSSAESQPFRQMRWVHCQKGNVAVAIGTESLQYPDEVKWSSEKNDEIVMCAELE